MKRLLLVIDYQNDFVNGSLGCPQAAAIEDALCAKLEARRAEGWDIAFTFDTHHENYPATEEGKHLPVPHCLEGSEGWQLHGKVAGYCTADTPRFCKETFGCAGLIPYLQEGGYETVELCGVVTSICVLSNAVLAKAALPNAQIIVDANCVAGGDDALSAKALDILENLHTTILNR